jgi:hypothetical protein
VADVGVSYTLTTPGGTVVFNDGSADQIYIGEIQGLGGAPIRAPMDDIPFGHGGLWYDFWEGPRHITFDGVFLITSTRWGDSVIVIRNQMEETLRVALRSISALETDTGTLDWTPQGQSARQLIVRCDQTVDFGHDQNYLLETFHFGLVAADPDWDGWSS